MHARERALQLENNPASSDRRGTSESPVHARTLLHDGCREAPVNAAEAVLGNDGAHAMEEAVVAALPGRPRELVVDELRLDRVHGRHRDDRLGDASAQASQERLAGGDLAVFVLEVVAQRLKSEEARCNLGNAEVKQRREAPV